MSQINKEPRQDYAISAISAFDFFLGKFVSYSSFLSSQSFLSHMRSARNAASCRLDNIDWIVPELSHKIMQAMHLDDAASN